MQNEAMNIQIWHYYVPEVKTRIATILKYPQKTLPRYDDLTLWILLQLSMSMGSSRLLSPTN